MENVNLEEIRSFYKRLNHEPYGITEVRAIGKTPETNKEVFIGFFNNEDAFVEYCQTYNEKGFNIYAGRNPRYEALFEKSPNIMRKGISGGSSGDVSAVTAIALDLDPIRHRGFPSTDSELEFAKSLGEKIVPDFPGSWLDMTGNGACIWMPIDPIKIGSGDENRMSLQTKLSAFEKFVTQTYLIGEWKDKVVIDTISDLPRINKVIGTISHKGTPSEDRPHRLTRFYSVSDTSFVPGLKDDIFSGKYSVTEAEVFIDNAKAVTPTVAYEEPSITVPDYRARQIVNKATREMCPPIKALFEEPGIKGDRSQALHLVFQYTLSKGFSFEDALTVVFAADKGDKFGNRMDKAREYFLKDYDELKGYAGSGKILPPCGKIKELFGYEHCNAPLRLGVSRDVIKQIIESLEIDIEGDDRELSLMDRIKENNIPDMLARLSDSQCEGYLSLLKNRLSINKSWIDLLRKDIKKIQKKMPKAPENVAEPEEVKELSPDEEFEAMEYLRDPNLIDNLMSDLKEVTGVIGQDNNLLIMYLSFTSRLFDEPFSFTLYGQSSSGKSYQANGVISTLPPEDVMILSSASAKAFEYCTESDLKHKAILIQEFDGASDAEATIRVMLSERRLCRLNTFTDPTTGKRTVDRTTIDAPCVVAITTTLIKNNDENETRIFKLYANESIDQTKNVVKLTLAKFTQEEKEREAVVKKKKALLQNVQRVLSRVQVFIPYAPLLRFPNTMIRNRRDGTRYMLLIKAVAFLRQYQKEKKYIDGIPCIDADLRDYEYAYRVGKDTLTNTLSTISEREYQVLEVAYRYASSRVLLQNQDRTGESRHTPDITSIPFMIRNLQACAKEISVDLENETNLRRAIKSLMTSEYIRQTDGGQGRVCTYQLLFVPSLDEHGNLRREDLVKNLTSPAELGKLLNQ